MTIRVIHQLLLLLLLLACLLIYGNLLYYLFEALVISRWDVDLLSCSSGGISHAEKINPRRSSTEVMDGSNESVVVPFGWRSRT